MSRLTRKPLRVPEDVRITIEGQTIRIKGSRGENRLDVHEKVRFELTEKGIVFYSDNETRAVAGTMYALTRNLIQGVSQGFERKLELVGVGYRAKAKDGNQLELQIGRSHLLSYRSLDGVTMETPSAVEVIVKGIDKQKVGQVATDIRAFHPPEPYKGKGIRYAGERIVMKDAKKK